VLGVLSVPGVAELLRPQAQPPAHNYRLFSSPVIPCSARLPGAEAGEGRTRMQVTGPGDGAGGWGLTTKAKSRLRSTSRILRCMDGSTDSGGQALSSCSYPGGRLGLQQACATIVSTYAVSGQRSPTLGMACIWRESQRGAYCWHRMRALGASLGLWSAWQHGPALKGSTRQRKHATRHETTQSTPRPPGLLCRGPRTTPDNASARHTPRNARRQRAGHGTHRALLGHRAAASPPSEHRGRSMQHSTPLPCRSQGSPCPPPIRIAARRSTWN